MKVNDVLSVGGQLEEVYVSREFAEMLLHEQEHGEWFKLTLDELREMTGLTEGKARNRNRDRDAERPNVAIADAGTRFRISAMGVKNISKLPKDVQAKLDQFLAFKRVSPMEPYGSTDYPFKAGFLQGIPHAHLTHDLSVVYTISGRNPRWITIHGVYSHDQLGTGNPGRPRLQSAMLDKITSQNEFTILEQLLRM